MANFTITETFPSRAGKLSASSGRTHTRHFYVSSDDADATDSDVLALDALPQLGDPYVTARGVVDAGAHVTDVDCKQRESPYEWDVTVTYSVEKRDARDASMGKGSGGEMSVPPDPNATGGGGNGGGGNGGGGNGQGGGGGGGPGESKNDNPLLEPAEIVWGSNRVMVVATHTADVDPQPIINSAGSPFDPPLMRPRARLTLRIVRNELDYDREKALDFVDTVNGGTWYGFPLKTVRCMGIGATRKHWNGIYYSQVTYEFEIDKQTWKERVLDAGTYCLQDSGEWGPIRNQTDGKAVTGPWPLDGNGQPMDLSDPDAEPVYLTFNIYESKDFRDLGLGGTPGQAR